MEELLTDPTKDELTAEAPPLELVELEDIGMALAFPSNALSMAACSFITSLRNFFNTAGELLEGPLGFDGPLPLF
jgi:hypothetical protein